jgi:hypothetical protein
MEHGRCTGTCEVSSILSTSCACRRNSEFELDDSDTGADSESGHSDMTSVVEYSFELGINEDDFGGPVWCSDRIFGTETTLSDGQVVQIGGEYEDEYDPDFVVYNDVIVYHRFC